VRHWCPYLWGRKFVVRTDHYALKFMLDQRLSTVPQLQWISKLFGFDFSVEYRPGRLNTVADALSHCDQQELQSNTMSMPSFDLFAELRSEINADPSLQHLRDNITAIRGDQWRSDQGLILKGSRVYLPPQSANIPTVLQMSHTCSS